MKMRIFIGFNNIVSLGTLLKIGFLKNGYKAEFYTTSKNLSIYNYYGNEQFKQLSLKRNRILRYLQSFIFFIKSILYFDTFIFISGQSLFTNYKDWKILKLLRKRIITIFMGCDVRIPDMLFKYKWNPCSICDDRYKQKVGCVVNVKIKKIDKIKKLSDIIFSPIECAAAFQNQYYNILFPVDTSYFLIRDNYQSKINNKKEIIILHAPSDYHIKGSYFIVEVIKKLKLKYKINFILLQNVPKTEVIKKINDADLIIDQMLVGFYGVFAVEAMMCSKPVICYIRPDIWEKIENECPIYNANPDTLYDVLENILKNPQQIEEIGRKSKEYAIKYHSPENVARYIISKIEERY